jgi:hypothetical protein
MLLLRSYQGFGLRQKTLSGTWPLVRQKGLEQRNLLPPSVTPSAAAAAAAAVHAAARVVERVVERRCRHSQTQQGFKLSA